MADKTSRKELRRPDEFISLTQKALTWVAENRFLVIGGAVIVVVVVLAFFGWRWYVESSTQKASVAFVEARKIMQAKVVPQEGAEGTSLADGTYASEDDKLHAALAALQNVKKEFPSAATASLADYFIGEVYHQLGEYDKAVAAFQDYLKREGANGELSAFAVEGIGATLEDKGDYKGAMEQYKRLTEEPFSSQKARGLYHLARMEQKLGQKEEAARQFAQLMTEFPDTPYARDVQERLSELPPVEKKAAPEKPQAGGEGKPTDESAKPAGSAAKNG